MRLGLDIEQFVRHPYGSGIQRVLQYLALTWPSGDVEPLFVVPVPHSPRAEFHLLSASQAAEILAIPFLESEQGQGSRDVKSEVESFLASMSLPAFTLGEVMAVVNVWMLPEVSYLPTVLDRFELFKQTMPAMMIGFDTLPMTEPANYRFKPGTESDVSRYFRLLATADSVVCISSFARNSIWQRLRRDRSLPCTVSHPGGDHVVTRLAPKRSASTGVARWCRVGTMEARKSPIEIANAFSQAIDIGAHAELVFVGGPSASDSAINSHIHSLIAAGYPIEWVTDASDSQVQELIAESDVFLSIGTEGYGIPVLEAIRLGTPVLYSGVQPAAELMEGQGSRGILGSLVDEFTQHDLSVETKFAGTYESTPTWREFAASMEKAVIHYFN